MNSLSNTLEDLTKIISQHPALGWALVLAASMLGTFVLKLALTLVTSRLRKLTARTNSIWDDVGLDIVDGLRSFVVFTWALNLLSKSLYQPELVQKLLLILVVVSTTYQVCIWGLYLIRNWKGTFLDHRIAADPSSSAALGLLYTVVQVIFLVIMVLIALSNLGVNISALVAGFGIGGIAVAFAAQNVLGDLLASLSIVLDKPFVVGDFIVSGDASGTVEATGVKTTRIRTLSGEQLIVSNKNLLESRIQNFKRMSQRRIVQKLGVTYSTPIEKLEQIPVWVGDAIKKHDKLMFDRCHLMNFGGSSLDFEIVFIVLDAEYGVYMNLQQEVLLDILRKFSAEKVDLAFPTQTVIIENNALPKPGPDPRPEPRLV